MSSVNEGEKPSRRKSKGSCARLIRAGLAGPLRRGRKPQPMGMGRTFPSLPGRDEVSFAVSPYWIGGAAGRLPGNSAGIKTVPQTDTGGRVEDTQAFERTVLKELGKMPP
jgi:hypothetical protein